MAPASARPPRLSTNILSVTSSTPRKRLWEQIGICRRGSRTRNQGVPHRLCSAKSTSTCTITTMPTSGAKPLSTTSIAAANTALCGDFGENFTPRRRERSESVFEPVHGRPDERLRRRFRLHPRHIHFHTHARALQALSAVMPAGASAIRPSTSTTNSNQATRDATHHRRARRATAKKWK